MIKTQNWIEYFVEYGNELEHGLLELMLDVYKMGAKQKHNDFEVEYSDDDWVKISGSVEGKEKVDAIAKILRDFLAEYNKEVADTAVAKYKLEHNITD